MSTKQTGGEVRHQKFSSLSFKAFISQLKMEIFLVVFLQVEFFENETPIKLL